ncbi:MAG: glycosyltransferase [Psychromonas sp.]|nr:glycosyltransferase [Alteromonadales bacterium]MCP5077650.1 glycosyltransferase [Psychromonas sp.]
MTELNKLILIGGGGHCSACIDVIESQQHYQIAGILDSEDKLGDTLLSYPYIGTDNDIDKYITDGYYFLITIGHLGNAHIREQLFTTINHLQGKLATVISPIAYVAKSATVGKGTIIMHHALINSNAQIGENCIINSKSLIEHDCTIQSNCHISTAATINGGVTVEECSFFGSNATCKQGSVITKGSFIKANSCFSNKEKTKTAVLTTIYPMDRQFIVDFFESMQAQSYTAFDIVVVNDGFEKFNEIKRKFPKLQITELPAVGCIAKNREQLLQFAKRNNYQTVILADSDDTFTKNRVSVCLKALQHTDIVVNDLSTIQSGMVLNDKIYSQRLANHSVITLGFITDKNIFGLSNTAINLQKVPLDLLSFPNELIAVDWYFFSLLLLNGLSASFSNDCVTYYRQHEKNTIGIALINQSVIKKIISTKEIHYQHLQKHDLLFSTLLDTTKRLKEQIASQATLDNLITLNSNTTTPLFWWELQVCTNEIN